MLANCDPELRQISCRLLECEESSSEPVNVQGSAAFRVCEKLRGPLGKLMGTNGFRSIFCRALVLASAEVPWLAALQIRADGLLEGLDDATLELNGGATSEGEIVLVSQLLGLLGTFIGVALTARLLRDIWPDMDDIKPRTSPML